MTNFYDSINIVLIHEGGYVDHPDDKGGATNYGISFRFAQSIDPSFTKDDIKILTKDSAIQLYFNGFWKPNRYEEIRCSIIATKVLDASINMGAGEANRILQNSCVEQGYDIKVDGINGSKTIYAVNECSSVRLLVSMRKRMREFYQELAKSISQKSFINGWMKRADW